MKIHFGLFFVALTWSSYVMSADDASNYVYDGYVYRVDIRPFTTVFNDGFRPLGIDDDLGRAALAENCRALTRGQQDTSQFVEFSINRQLMNAYARHVSQMRPHEIVSVYRVRMTSEMYHLRRSIRHHENLHQIPIIFSLEFAANPDYFITPVHVLGQDVQSADEYLNGNFRSSRFNQNTTSEIPDLDMRIYEQSETTYSLTEEASLRFDADFYRQTRREVTACLANIDDQACADSKPMFSSLSYGSTSKFDYCAPRQINIVEKPISQVKARNLLPILFSAAN
ncbi:MAG: hypothetical protein JHC61_16485 [Burkholderiaceae bacterium]|nr:hypothetical protein [Burkholderiaceae bacterium]